MLSSRRSSVDFQQFNLEFERRVWRNDLSKPPITIGLYRIKKSENRGISIKSGGRDWKKKGRNETDVFCRGYDDSFLS
jgi:hypothetical protein